MEKKKPYHEKYPKGSIVLLEKGSQLKKVVTLHWKFGFNMFLKFGSDDWIIIPLLWFHVFVSGLQSALLALPK